MVGLSGGDKLDARLREFADKVARPATLRVGFLEGATYPDGTPVALVAAVQNFGSPAQGIPPRPFFTNMIAEKKDRWGDQLANLLKMNDWDAKKALYLMGAGIAVQLRDSINQMNSPPLAPETIRRKGGTPTAAKPLIDTGHMFQSVEYEIDDERYAYSNESQSWELKEA